MLYLKTKFGNEYNISNQGHIQRLDMVDFRSSKEWLILGIEHVKRNEFISLRDLLKGRLPKNLKFKNGNPQWTVRDQDHGTIRTWGNTEYHGIEKIEIK